MAAATYDMKIEQGVSRKVIFRWKDGDGVPVDLSDYTARMQFRPSRTSDTVFLELTTENGGIDLGGVDGTITLIFTDEQTGALSKGGVYDVKLYIDGEARRFVEGAIEVSTGVTRDE